MVAGECATELKKHKDKKAPRMLNRGAKFYSLYIAVYEHKKANRDLSPDWLFDL